MKIAGRALLCFPRRAWRDGDGQLRHQSSLVFATELLGSLASGAWRRDRGAGQERGGRSEVLAAEGGQGGGREAALTIGFGERGFPHFCEQSRFFGHIFRP